MTTLALLLPVVVPAAVAIGVAIGTVWQKNRTDQRDAWWRRVQWAMEAASTPGAENELRRTMGLLALSALADEEAASPTDDALIFAVANSVLDTAPGPKELDFWENVLKEADEDE